MSLFQNDFLYSFVEMNKTMIKPFRMYAHYNQKMHSHDHNPLAETKWAKSLAAGLELFERVTRHYSKPEFRIKHTLVDGKKVSIKEEVLLKRPFCELLHFKKQSKSRLPRQEKMLIVAPMSGHFATLLRGTVEGLLPHFDVYITDWYNASDVPLEDGDFCFDEFVDYTIDFIKKIGKNINVLAVCQPSVPVLAAISIMSSEKSPYAPKTMTLMGGPVDARKSPTQVNDFAVEREIEWFEHALITRVPPNYEGRGRRVYPGFLQLSGFMAMNLHKHIDAHMKFFNHLVEGDGESAAAHRKFYNEYLSVMDLPADFYLETIRIVFQEFLLPRGKLVSRGRKVDPTAIKKTALLTVEGERDDISGIGQTKAALKVCKGIPDKRKEYYLQREVGHYGIFNGRRYREEVVPKICEFVGRIKPLK